MGKKVWFGMICFVMLGVLLLAAALGGCGKKKGEPPADTPWNNGYCAIMETETGYYSNLVGQQQLRYYEKNTGTEIFLCAKPECQHGGEETCTATYRNMKVVNSVLYDGAIYILAIENQNHVVSYNLYRAALDGSALDKVGEVFSATNTTEEDIYLAPNVALIFGEPTAFVIHKGYAYVPFFMAFKWSAKGFVNGGIMKVDIRTGQAEQIYQMDKLNALYPVKLWGCGDYLYCNMDSSNYNSGRHGTYRYSILDGSEEFVGKVLWPDEKVGDFQILWVTEDEVFYDITWNGEGQMGIGRYERKDGELLHKLMFLLEEDDGFRVSMAIYEDKFFVYGTNGVSLYDMDGKRLGGIAYDFPGVDWEIDFSGSYRPVFHIFGGKLYASLKNQNYNIYSNDPYGNSYYDVFGCLLEELAGGNGKWELVYSVKNQHPEHMQGGRIMRGE